jgi:hypothetical protein
MGFRVTAVLATALSLTAASGCDDPLHADADSFPLVDGARVSDDWEVPSGVTADFIRYLVVEGPEGWTAKDLIVAQRAELEARGWELKRPDADGLISGYSDDVPDAARFGPIEAMSRETMGARARNGLDESSADLDRSIVVQLVSRDPYG